MIEYGYKYIRPENIVRIVEYKPTIAEKVFDWFRYVLWLSGVLVMIGIGTVAAIKDPHSFAIGVAIGLATGAR